MKHACLWIVFSSLLAPVILVSGAADARAEDASEIFIMPPQYDYGAVCKAEAHRFNPEEIEKLRRRPFTELSPEALVRLAEAYSDNSDVIAPDYPFVLSIVDHLQKLPYRGENQPFIDDALFIKADILYKGKAGEVKLKEAKSILDTLISRHHAKAYRRYGEIYESEQRFAKAAEAYKKAIIGGNITAYFNLTRLYHQQKVKVSPAEFRRALSNMQDAALQNIAQGNCQVMVELARFYDLLGEEKGATVHSLAWYKQAAAAPIIPAKLLYADRLMRQPDAKDRWPEIVALWEEAAALGSVKAMRNLGDYYLSENAFAPEKAAHWLQQASRRKDVKMSTLMRWADSLKYQSPPPYAQIIAIYERAANQGHAEAWHRLGRLYQYDIRSDGHLAKAMDYYRKAAEARYAPAMKAMQTAYSCGIGVGFNQDMAQYWQQQAEAVSNEGFIAAFLQEAENNFDGVTYAMRKRLEALASKNQRDAQAVLAAYHFRQGDEELANRETEKLLREDIQEEGYPAHYLLGKLYYEGVFEDKKADGLELLERAAEAGNTDAMIVLGDIQAESGRFEQAISYYQEAARENDAAVRKLYFAYLDAGDIPQAVQALERLAGNKDAQAMLRLAEHYAYDLQDPQNAGYWFEQTVRHYPCDPEMVQRIAEAYMQGHIGAPLDKEKAREWQRYLYQMPLHSHNDPVALARTILYIDGAEGAEAARKKSEALKALTDMADAGNAEAEQTLLDYYLQRSDAKQLLDMLTEQAESGSATAMIYLSNLFLSGFADIPPDKGKAVYWLKQAKEAGSATATTRLSLLTQ